VSPKNLVKALRKEKHKDIFDDLVEKDVTSIKELGHKLEQVLSQLRDATNTINKIWTRLYTTELDSRGPLRETNDDIPF
jgi:hypothetical protein